MSNLSSASPKKQTQRPRILGASKHAAALESILSSTATQASKISKLEDLLKELDGVITRKSLEIGMHHHLKTVAMEDRDSIATRLNEAHAELKSLGQRLEEATASLSSMRTTITSQAIEREGLCTRLNNGEAQLRATEQRLRDTEARVLNMASFIESRAAEFQQEKDYLTNEVIKYAQNEKELLAENVQWQQEYARLQEEHQSSASEIQKLKDVVDSSYQKVTSCVECSLCYCLNIVPIRLHCDHGFCGKCVMSWLTVNPRSATCPACRSPITPKPSVDRPLAEIIHTLLKTIEPAKILEEIGTLDFDGEMTRLQLQLDNHFRRYS